MEIQDQNEQFTVSFFVNLDAVQANTNVLKRTSASWKRIAWVFVAPVSVYHSKEKRRRARHQFVASLLSRTYHGYNVIRVRGERTDHFRTFERP